MTRQPHVTRTLDTTRGALVRGTVDLPEGVSWLVLPNDANPAKWTRLGEFPHAEFVGLEDQCRARLLLVVNRGRIDEFSHDPECSRLFEHDGPHVAHIGPGSPIAAWTDATVTI